MAHPARTASDADSDSDVALVFDAMKEEHLSSKYIAARGVLQAKVMKLLTPKQVRRRALQGQDARGAGVLCARIVC
jgi:hypothetical protein